MGQHGTAQHLSILITCAHNVSEDSLLQVSALCGPGPAGANEPEREWENAVRERTELAA